MPNTSGFGPAITQATQSSGGTYTDVVQTPFDTGLAGRSVILIDSLAALEAYRQDGWRFSPSYPIRSRYYIAGNGTQDLVIDLEGVSHTLRHPIEIHNVQRTKIIGVEQQFRVSDQTDYPNAYPSWVCPYPPLGGAMGIRWAPSGEAMLWIEGHYMNGYDSVAGYAHTMDAIVFRGNNCHPTNSWLTSAVYVQNSRFEGLEGSNKRQDGTTPQVPEIHSDLFQAQGPGDTLACPRKFFWENMCFSGSMGGINQEYFSGNGLTTTDDEWVWFRNCNFNLTTKYSNQYRSGSGNGIGSSRFRDYTPANYASKSRIYHENVKHSRYSEYYFGSYGLFPPSAKNLFIAGWNQSFGDSRVYTDPEVTWYADHTTWGPDPAWEFVTPANLGGNYTSPHTHNHR